MKQLLAKLGVFALIVVNLGAYYVFWPDQTGHGTGADKTENPGKTAPPATNGTTPSTDSWTPVATTTPPAAPPAPVVPAVPTQPAQSSNGPDIVLPEPVTPKPPAPQPLQPRKVADYGEMSEPPAPPKRVGQSSDPTKEKLKQLMETFTNNEPGGKPAEPPPLGMLRTTDPTIPPATSAGAPKPSGELLAAAAHQAPARKTRMDNSPWSLQWEINEGRTSLTAKLNKRLEFRIVGDRVSMETPDGAVVALGKVVFTGPNMKGSCDKLTIGLTGDTVTLEGKAQLQIQQGNLTDLAIPTIDLNGERFSLRLQQLTGNLAPTVVRPSTPPATPPEVIPASAPSPFTIPQPLPLLQKSGS